MYEQKAIPAKSKLSRPWLSLQGQPSIAAKGAQNGTLMKLDSQAAHAKQDEGGDKG